MLNYILNKLSIAIDNLQQTQDKNPKVLWRSKHKKENFQAETFLKGVKKFILVLGIMLILIIL